MTPGENLGDAPSDAIVLFDGKDLSHWQPATQVMPTGPVIRPGPPGWKVENGYMEVVLGSGDIATKEKFGDVQLHVVFAEPAEIRGNSQNRGNSGIFMQGRYETQVLDGWNNPDLRRWPGRRDLRAVAAAGESVAQAGRVADLRHRI